MSLEEELFEAIQARDGYKVKRLLEKGANINAKDNIGWTPLHFAAYHGITDIVRLLLEHGADINARDADGLTPLHIAAALGHVDAVRLLLRKGADPGARDNRGRTPLDLAREGGHAEAIRIIEESRITKFAEEPSSPPKGSVFRDPQVSKRWKELVSWLRRRQPYWREEVLSLLSLVELLVHDSLIAANRLGIDQTLTAKEVSEKVRELLIYYQVQPELIQGYELKGIRREVAEVLTAIFPRLSQPRGTVTSLASAQVKITPEKLPGKPSREIPGGGSATSLTSLSNLCPECGSELIYIKTLKRYYCFRCKKYAK